MALAAASSADGRLSPVSQAEAALPEDSSLRNNPVIQKA